MAVIRGICVHELLTFLKLEVVSFYHLFTNVFTNNVISSI